MMQSLRPLLVMMLTLLAACSLENGVPAISQQQLLDTINGGEDILILDVRTTGEYAEGFIPGAKHIDHREIDERLHEISDQKQRPVVVYCLSGIRAAMVESTLIENGFDRVFHLQGDWSAWKENSLPITKPDKNGAQL